MKGRFFFLMNGKKSKTAKEEWEIVIEWPERVKHHIEVNELRTSET